MCGGEIYVKKIPSMMVIDIANAVDKNATQDIVGIRPGEKVQKYWGGKPSKIDYSQMDQSIIKEFTGTHPKIVQSWLPKDIGVYKTDSSYQPTKKQKKHRLMLNLEKLFRLELSKKHYKLL